MLWVFLGIAAVTVLGILFSAKEKVDKMKEDAGMSSKDKKK